GHLGCALESEEVDRDAIKAGHRLGRPDPHRGQFRDVLLDVRSIAPGPSGDDQGVDRCRFDDAGDLEVEALHVGGQSAQKYVSPSGHQNTSSTSALICEYGLRVTPRTKCGTLASR